MTTSRFLLAAFCAWRLTTAILGAQALDIKHVKFLVENIPVALKIKAANGCLAADYSDMGSELALVQLRNKCPQYGSGLIGDFVVDRHSGRIWSDIDQSAEVDSAHLRQLRRRFLRKK